MSVLRDVGAKDVLAALIARNPGTRVVPDDVSGARVLMRELWYAGAREQAEELAVNVANNVVFDDALAIAELVKGLDTIKSKRSLDVLLGRGLVAHVSLDDRGAIADIVNSLYNFKAHEEASALTTRSVAHFGQEFLEEDILMLRSLLKRQKSYQPSPNLILRDLEAVVGQWPDGGPGEVNARQSVLAIVVDPVVLADGQEWYRYRFGCEPDGTPAEPWGWDDLVKP